MRSSYARRAVAVLSVTGLMLAACSNTGGDDASGEDATSDAAATTEADDGGDGTDVEMGTGVTADACPDAVNPDNGCIYLGLISDLTDGPYAPVSVPVTEAQRAFWTRVNEQGGIGGAFDVNVDEYTRDNHYNPEQHSLAYEEIKPEVLALAQSLGSPTTAAIIEDMLANDVLATPGGWTSLYDTNDPGRVILESGPPYCIESMNAVDYFAEQNGGLDSVTIVHVPGDFGEDAGVGAKLAAEAQGAEVEVIEVSPTATGGELQGAINGITNGDPDLVIPAVSPTQLAEIVGGAVSGGYEGRFIGPGPTWNPGLLESPAGDALVAQYWQSRPWGDYEFDSPGHEAMREALGDLEQVNWGYTSGWIWSYPLKAALEAAHDNGALTREGLVAAVDDLTEVDYEGMLPDGAGNFTGTPDEQIFRQSLIAEPDRDSIEGTTVIEDFFTGPTAESFTFEGACYQTESL